MVRAGTQIWQGSILEAIRRQWRTARVVLVDDPGKDGHDAGGRRRLKEIVLFDDAANTGRCYAVPTQIHTHGKNFKRETPTPNDKRLEETHVHNRPA